MPINSVFQNSDLYCRKTLIFVRILLCINRMWLLLLNSCKHLSFLLGIGIIWYLYCWQSGRGSCLRKHPLLNAVIWGSRFCYKGVSGRAQWQMWSHPRWTPFENQWWGLSSTAFSLPAPTGRYCFILKGQTYCTYTQKCYDIKICLRPDDNIPETVLNKNFGALMSRTLHLFYIRSKC